jgi:hypothetical protein
LGDLLLGYVFLFLFWGVLPYTLETL